MSQCQWKQFEKRNSSEDINLHCESQVVDTVNKSNQPQLKYMMSSNSSNLNDEVNENSSEKEFDKNSIELQVNKQFQNDMNIQSYKHQEVYNLKQNEQKRHIRTRRKINANLSLKDYQSENDSSFQNQSIIVCKCTKSNCLKLYCKCFHQNQKCSDFCKCRECKNKTEHFEIRYNALEKVKQKLHKQINDDDDLFDRQRIWGCKCQKSQCQKNYCECFVRNQKCSSNCKCKDCENKKRFPFQQKKQQKIQSQIQVQF